MLLESSLVTLYQHSSRSKRIFFISSLTLRVRTVFQKICKNVANFPILFALQEQTSTLRRKIRGCFYVEFSAESNEPGLFF